MGRFVKGDVVVLPFPYSDLTTSKKRPALVVAPLSIHDDVLLCMSTSRSTKNTSAVAITASDFVAGSLPHDSYVRPSRLFTADSSIVLYKAGELSGDKVTAVVDEIIRIVST